MAFELNGKEVKPFMMSVTHGKGKKKKTETFAVIGKATEYNDEQSQVSLTIMDDVPTKQEDGSYEFEPGERSVTRYIKVDTENTLKFIV